MNSLAWVVVAVLTALVVILAERQVVLRLESPDRRRVHQGHVVFRLLTLVATSLALTCLSGMTASAAPGLTDEVVGYNYDGSLQRSAGHPSLAQLVATSSRTTRVDRVQPTEHHQLVAFGSAAKAGDDIVLVRGGTNTAERFANGSGVTSDATGNLSGVSVNSGRTVEGAAQGIRNNQIGVSTVGDVRRAGGTVTRDPTPYNPNHCLISGCTADVFSDLFTPTIKNPWK